MLVFFHAEQCVMYDEQAYFRLLNNSEQFESSVGRFWHAAWWRLIRVDHSLALAH